jgi:hypothetical protein
MLSLSVTLHLNKLSLSRRGQLTTISSNNKRVRALHDIPEWFVTKYSVNTNDVQAGQLTFKNGQFWLCLVYKVKEKVKTENNRN